MTSKASSTSPAVTNDDSTPDVPNDEVTKTNIAQAMLATLEENTSLKKFLKRAAIATAIAVPVILAVGYALGKSSDSDDEENEETTED
jgi:hypothetical protein